MQVTYANKSKNCEVEKSGGAGTIFFFANLDVKKKQAPKERVFGIEL